MSTYRLGDTVVCCLTLVECRSCTKRKRPSDCEVEFCRYCPGHRGLGIKYGAAATHCRVKLSCGGVRDAPTTPSPSQSVFNMGHKVVNPAHRVAGKPPLGLRRRRRLQWSAATRDQHTDNERPRGWSLFHHHRHHHPELPDPAVLDSCKHEVIVTRRLMAASISSVVELSSATGPSGFGSSIIAKSGAVSARNFLFFRTWGMPRLSVFRYSSPEMLKSHGSVRRCHHED